MIPDRWADGEPKDEGPEKGQFPEQQQQSVCGPAGAGNTDERRETEGHLYDGQEGWRSSKASSMPNSVVSLSFGLVSRSGAEN